MEARRRPIDVWKLAQVRSGIEERARERESESERARARERESETLEKERNILCQQNE